VLKLLRGPRDEVVLKSPVLGHGVVLKPLIYEHRYVFEALTSRQAHGRFAHSTDDAE
jgi:hypothetical protein